MIHSEETILYSEFNIHRKKPINAFSGSDSNFVKNVNPFFQAVPLFEYQNVNVTPEGIVFKRLNLDQDLLIYKKHRKIYNSLYLLSSLIKRKKIKLPNDEKYLLCFDYWSNSVFHWMCDALPRIESVKELAKECVLLLPKQFTSPYILETLKAFEFKSIYLLDENVYVNCQKLYSPKQITLSGQISPTNILSLQKTLLTYFKTKFTGRITFPNIYISREKARFRKVLNEKDILPILKKYNFEIIFFEDYKVCEQIELCYNASNIVSIHGANLTNLVFLKPGKNVLELRKKGDEDNNYFYELTDSINCNYYYLECDFEDPKPLTNTFNLYVQPELFEHALIQLTA